MTENYPYFVVGIVLLTIIAFMIWGCARTPCRSAPEAPLPPPMPLPLPDLTLDELRPMVGVQETGRRAGDTHHRIACDVRFEGLFGAPQESHFALMTRCTLDGVPSGAYRGIGWVAGRLYSGDEKAPFPFPSDFAASCCESWRNGRLPTPDWPWLKAESVSHPLHDDQTYRAVFESWPEPGGWGYRWRIDGFDSGIQFCDNTDIDPAEQALGFAIIGPGCVRLTHIVSTWDHA